MKYISLAIFVITFIAGAFLAFKPLLAETHRVAKPLHAEGNYVTVARYLSERQVEAVVEALSYHYASHFHNPNGLKIMYTIEVECDGMAALLVHNTHVAQALWALSIPTDSGFFISSGEPRGTLISEMKFEDIIYTHLLDYLLHNIEDNRKEFVQRFGTSALSLPMARSQRTLESFMSIALFNNIDAVSQARVRIVYDLDSQGEIHTLFSSEVAFVLLSAPLSDEIVSNLIIQTKNDIMEYFKYTFEAAIKHYELQVIGDNDFMLSFTGSFERQRYGH